MLGTPGNWYVTCICVRMYVCIRVHETGSRVQPKTRLSWAPALLVCYIEWCLPASPFISITRRTFLKICQQCIHTTRVLFGLWTTGQPHLPHYSCLHLTFSVSPFCCLLFPRQAGKSWGPVTATRVWSVIRGWVIRMESGWCGNDCSGSVQLTWWAAHHAWKPWGSLCHGVFRCKLWSHWAGTRGLGATSGPQWVWELCGLLECSCNPYRSHIGFLFIFPSMGWNWLCV